MAAADKQPGRLPSADEVRRAVDLYLPRAYPQGVPPAVNRFVPPEEFDPAEWLMGCLTERDPPDAPLEGVRSFALRIGNARYPHMKLRLSRPPKDRLFVFLVDCHDAFLAAAAATPDHDELEQLKRHNASIAAAVHAAWDAAGLPTERSYLRKRIRRAKTERSRSGGTRDNDS